MPIAYVKLNTVYIDKSRKIQSNWVYIYIYHRYNKLDDLFIKVFNAVFEDFHESYSIHRDRGSDDIHS